VAENVSITPGTGAVVGTDEVTINGVLVQVQRVKLVDSTEGGTAAQFPAPAALADAAANPTTILLGNCLMTWNGTTWDRLRLPIAAALADGLTNPTTTGVASYGHRYNGATWDRERVPTVFTTFDLSAATAETTLWTPTSGKKFRFMGFLVFTGATSTKLTFKDNTAGSTILIHGLPGGWMIQVDLGSKGILSAAANNVLTVTRSGSTTLSGTVYGTEE